MATRWTDRGRRGWNSGWGELDEMFSSLEAFRQLMDRAFDDGVRAERGLVGSWPRANLTDTGSALVLTAEVPGLSERDVNITLNQDVLTVSGERKTAVPEGYTAYRQERGTVKFSRSFSLPSRVDGEKASATVKNGILTVTLDKAPDAVPRQIAVTG